MRMAWKVVPNGTITTPRGFLAGATYAGLKTYGEEKLDLGILFSEATCRAAGVFTTNKIVAAPVVLTRERLRDKRARAIVANGGCANACVGPQGMIDARNTSELTAKKLEIAPEEVLVASTGIIGVELPMGLIRAGLSRIALSTDGGHALARAIMTTDTRPKEVALSVEVGGKEITIGGIAKGAGMIHPNMATMLCFLATDGKVEPNFLDKALREAVDASFNMITVDGDTSTNDMVLILANGLAGNRPLKEDSPGAGAFRDSLKEVCTQLAREIVRDGEGATKLIEVVVEGALTLSDARAAARTVAGSTLLKTAVHGNDPNWGRVIAALGRSGAQIDDSKLVVHINEICVMDGGVPIPFYKDAAVAAMNRPEVSIGIRLNLGNARATAWGCDLTEKYVQINSQYTT
ncbi:MAG: bifunctional glutamate N-acetyltransferase/amino-acid acetyltransferase ArgJ [Chloroflexi bacterium]|nr:bifunctional glutamate N-acetyltransferase/amino-acid acetyltransferase ArgJ [Chloroflexota bacterium]